MKDGFQPRSRDVRNFNKGLRNIKLIFESSVRTVKTITTFILTVSEGAKHPKQSDKRTQPRV